MSEMRGETSVRSVLGRGREPRLEEAREGKEAEDRADDAERVGDRVTDRGIAACSVAVLVSEPAKSPIE